MPGGQRRQEGHIVNRGDLGGDVVANVQRDRQG